MRARGRPLRASLHLRAPRRDHLLPHVAERKGALLDPAYDRMPPGTDLSTMRLGVRELLRRLQLDRLRDDQHHNDHDEHDDDQHHDDRNHDNRHHGDEHHDHHDFLVPADHGLLLRPVL